MEHVIQFGIGIDDRAIVQRVEENAEKVIIEDLKKEVKKAIFEVGNGWYDRDQVKGPSYWFEQRINEWLEEHKDEIIQVTSDKLADKLSRTKAVKEAAARIAEEV